MSHVGFEYRGNGGETVFETFLKYSNEKEKSSVVLGSILQQILAKGKWEEIVTLLDIGAGNGEYLRLSLRWVKRLDGVEFTLLEPSDNLIKRLRLSAKRFPVWSSVKIVHSTFEGFASDRQFDVILASHLPFARDKLPMVYRKMLELLKLDGHLIVVLRRKDDIHEFRTTFKSKLMGMDYTSLTIDDAVEVFNKLAENIPLRLSMFSSNSELHLPIADKMQDVISIIEFFLNKKWEEFPKSICVEVMNYIAQKGGVLHQIDGFAVVRKI